MHGGAEPLSAGRQYAVVGSDLQHHAIAARQMATACPDASTREILSLETARTATPIFSTQKIEELALRRNCTAL